MGPRRLLLPFLILAAVAGCRSSGGPAETPPPPRSDEIDNDKLIAWMKATVDKNPSSGFRDRLVGIYLERGQMRGSLDDFERAIRYSSMILDGTPGSATYKSRAMAELALHRVDDAEKDLIAAQHHADSEPEQTKLLLADVALARGQYDAAKKVFEATLAAKPNDLGAALRLANLDVDLGELDAADRLFDRAEKIAGEHEKGLRAWIDVQRGMRQVDSGEWAEAEASDRAALALDSKSAPASARLAEVLVLEGQKDEAEAIWKAEIAASDAVEAWASMARVEPDPSWQEGARTRYEAEASAYPEAIWQHEALFLLDTGGDAAKARELMEKDVALRPNVAGFLPLARAQLATGDAAAAKKTIDLALATPVKTAKLFWTAARVYDSSGDTRAAEDFRAKARAIDPRIEQQSPK